MPPTLWPSWTHPFRQIVFARMYFKIIPYQHSFFLKLYNTVRRRTVNWSFGSTACPQVRTDSGVSHTTSTQPPFFSFWYFLLGLCLPVIWINFWHDVTVQLTIAACHPLTFLQSFIAWYLRMHFMHPSF